MGKDRTMHFIRRANRFRAVSQDFCEADIIRKILPFNFDGQGI